MNKLFAFGDSFTWGTELLDSIDGSLNDRLNLQTYVDFHHDTTQMAVYCDPDYEHKVVSYSAAGYSRFTWPALLASYKKLTYRCYAQPGTSNDTIVRNFFRFVTHMSSLDFVVINWTWIDRYDIFDNTLLASHTQQWKTLIPAEFTGTDLEKSYINYFQTELLDKFNTLTSILLIISILRHKKIPFIMTSIDKLITDTASHCPDYIKTLQDEIKDDITWFDDFGFYNWALDKGFKMGSDGHPLEEAHQAAFEYIKPDHAPSK